MTHPRSGLAAAAWLAPKALGVVFGLFIAVCLQPALAGEGGNLQPTIQKATKGERCVAEPAVMRRDHPAMLKHQRDDTVHAGIRGAKHSLAGCIGCHAGAQTGSVAQAPGDFCVSCHRYAAVTIDCFECHSGKPRAVALKAGP